MSKTQEQAQTELAKINARYNELAASSKYPKDTLGDNKMVVAMADTLPASAYTVTEAGVCEVLVDGKVFASVTPPQSPTEKYQGTFSLGTVTRSIPKWACERIERHCKGTGRKSAGGAGKGDLMAALMAQSA
jgi:hypothetical protein